MTTLDSFIAALRDHGCKPEPDGNGWRASCPGSRHEHGNRDRPALSFDSGRDQAVIAKCHAGCTFEEVVQALGLHHANGSDQKRRIIANYAYRSADGELLYEVVRFSPKDFRQRRPDGRGGWAWKLAGVPRVPYRLPEILKAPIEVPIFVLEGEKDVETLVERLGGVGTTCAGGAGKWKQLGSEAVRLAFQDRDVVIIGDHDAPGLEHAHDVAQRLHGLARRVRVIESLPGVGPKGDLTDWVELGHTATDLWRLVEATPEYARESPEIETQGSRRLHDVFTLHERFGDVDFLVEGMLPDAGISALFGESGCGKSAIAVGLALHIVGGLGEWCGLNLPQGAGRVVYISGEGTVDLVGRFLAGGARLGIPDEILRERLLVSDCSAELIEEQDVDAWIAEIDEFGARSELPIRLLVVDTLAQNFGDGDENKVADMGRFVKAAQRLQVRFKALVVILHHTPLEDAGRMRGSSSFKGALDAAVLVARRDETIAIILHKGKFLELPHGPLVRGQIVGAPIPGSDDRCAAFFQPGARTVDRDALRKNSGILDPETARAWRDAAYVCLAVAREPGIKTRDLRPAVKAIGLLLDDAKVGTVRCDVARQMLGDSLVKRAGPSGSENHFLDVEKIPTSVLEAMSPDEREEVLNARVEEETA